MKLCKDCKHFVHEVFEIGGFDRMNRYICGANSPIEPVHGERLVVECADNRSSLYLRNNCGPDAKLFEAKP